IVMVTLTAIDSSGNETIETFDIEVQETAPVVPLNCRIRISPSVHPDGTITVRVDDLITNASCLANHDVRVYNQWGGVLWEQSGMRSSDYVLEGVNLCDYLGAGLEVSVGNELGSCTSTLLLDENGSVEMISAFGTRIDEASDLDIPTARIDTGLLVTYCGYVPSPEDHEPLVIIPCSTINTRSSST
ncbi:hypothetical protein, partial [Membranihabitans maritimus]|uniref:hypothetical protein n=1 Tax=Membranihabitans maritimus TaxID=2904244 RepID=UPI001F193CA5